MSREFDYEEEFHGRDRKAFRKERKQAQSLDRSKFKKSDREEREKVEIDPNWTKGRVVAISGEGYWVDANGSRFLASLRGLLKKERMEAKNLIAVGDFVWFTPDHSIAHIEERYSFLARTDITGRKEQLIAVNIDQAIITVSVVNPPLKPALVDRYLIAAEKGNIHPILLINKIDLLQGATQKEIDLYRNFLAAYEPIGIPILSVSSLQETGFEALRSLLKDKTSVISGQSGVGKSSLINAAFGLSLKTGDLAQKTAKGSHTTTTAELLPLPEGGYCVDTPGIRSFGVWKLQKEEVVGHFYEFRNLHCKYPDCNHLTEPECAVLKGLEEGRISPIRYESYRTLLDEATGGSDNWAKRKENNEFD